MSDEKAYAKEAKCLDSSDVALDELLALIEKAEDRKSSSGQQGQDGGRGHQASAEAGQGVVRHQTSGQGGGEFL